MATNFSIADAARIITEGKDTEAIVEIGRRFPVLAVKLAKVGTKAGEDFIDFMNLFPEYITANKINTVLKKSLEDGGSADDEDVEDTSEDATEETEDDGLDDMSASEIWEEMKKRGLDKTVKSKKKGDRIAAIREYDANGGEAAAEEDDVEEDSNPYAGKNAMELFKECKKRGIKAAPKKKAEFYVDLLMKDDEKSAEEETAEEEDWDDAEEEKPAKKEAKKAPEKKAAPAKKAAKKEEEEDDDWDI